MRRVPAAQPIGRFVTLDQDSLVLRPYVPRSRLDWLRNTPRDLGDRGHPRLRRHLRLHPADRAPVTQGEDRRRGDERPARCLLRRVAGRCVRLRRRGREMGRGRRPPPLRRRQHAARACRAALRDARTMRPAAGCDTSVGPRHPADVAGGAQRWLRLLPGRRPADHRELLVSGPAASTVPDEAEADAGEIAVSQETAAMLASEPWGPTREVACSSRHTWAHAPGPPRPSSDLDLRCRSPSPPQHVLVAQGDAEHRPIAVGFVQFSAPTPFWSARVREALGPGWTRRSASFKTQARPRGDVLRVRHQPRRRQDHADRRAPRSAGDDEERMLRAGRLIIDRIGALPLRVGVNRGPVFSGTSGRPSARPSGQGRRDQPRGPGHGQARPGQFLVRGGARRS